jgi:hypothetical protein
VRKWLLTLAVCFGLALALPVGYVVEDARQRAFLDARVWDAEDRFERAYRHENPPGGDEAPAEEEAEPDARGSWELWQELERARAERNEWRRREEERRQNPWHARLLDEARRRAGW